MCEQPWLLAGDFNEMLSSNEKDSCASFDFRIVWLFRDFVNECGVIEASIKGCFYTWMNGRGGEDFVQKRLNIVLINPTLMVSFPNLIIEVPFNIGSDHNMLICESMPRASFNRKRCFKYEIKWEEDITGIIRL